MHVDVSVDDEGIAILHIVKELVPCEHLPGLWARRRRMPNSERVR